MTVPLLMIVKPVPTMPAPLPPVMPPQFVKLAPLAVNCAPTPPAPPVMVPPDWRHVCVPAYRDYTDRAFKRGDRS
jgi:hypothetical protein